jgi:hypothetical protein
VTALGRALVAAALVVTPAACGSHGASMDASGNTFSWKEGGVLHTAPSATATRTKGNSADSLVLAGVDGSGVSIELQVVAMPFPMLTLLPGSGLNCSVPGPGFNATFKYSVGGASSADWAACSIDFRELGDVTGSRTTGVFSAMFMLAGNPTTITEGMFDLPLIVTTL